MTAATLQALLAARGTAWSAPIEQLDTTASTNDRLRALADGGAPEWTVVLAERQTAGRGRHGRAWHSPPGGLFLSVLLRPSFTWERAGLISLAAGVATAEALEAFHVEPSLKWPNDVLVGGKKIAGILCEATAGGTGIESVAVGIGVNVAGSWEGASPELRERVTSLLGEGASQMEPVRVAAEVLARLPVWYHAASSGRALLEAWQARSGPFWGRRVEVRAGGAVLRGRPRSLADDGGLVLELEGGSVTKVLSGEVRELRADPP